MKSCEQIDKDFSTDRTDSINALRDCDKQCTLIFLFERS